LAAVECRSSLGQGLGNNPKGQGNLAETTALLFRGNGRDWAAPGESLEELQSHSSIYGGVCG